MKKSDIWSFIYKHRVNILIILTLLSIVLGVSVGLIFRLEIEIPAKIIFLISFPGEVLMNILKMLIIPLIVSSLITGLSRLDLEAAGKMGLYTLLFYFVTTFISVITGIILVLSIHPGDPEVKRVLGSGNSKVQRQSNTLDAFLDLFRNLFPSNLVQACFEQAYSEFKIVNYTRILNNITTSRNITKLIINYRKSTNVLGLVLYSIVFGIILGKMGKDGTVVVQFFAILNAVTMKMIIITMWYSPIGIFFLIIGKIVEIENLEETFKSLGRFVGTVLLGLFFHALVTLSLIYFVITRKNPFSYMGGMLQALITALGTASSSATLPLTLKCLEENNHIDIRVTRFMLPIGATINMDGTALYEAVASIFIAQINDFNLSMGQVFTISVTATLAAIGAASVPGAGLVTLILVLTSVGLPVDDISLLVAVDWLLDRFRTTVNVLGDGIGSGIVAHLCKDQLKEVIHNIDPSGEVVKDVTV